MSHSCRHHVSDRHRLLLLAAIERGLDHERDLDGGALQDVLQPFFGDPELKRKA